MSDQPCPSCERDLSYPGQPGHECYTAVSRTVGMCTACGAVEVFLDRPTGVRDLSSIGESSRYPTGYGCEVCS